MSEKKLKVFSGEFKAKVALEAVRGVSTVNQIAQEFGVHPSGSLPSYNGSGVRVWIEGGRRTLLKWD